MPEVLTQLPGDFPTPILIVQHMPSGFTKSLANRLDGLCKIGVKEVEDGYLLKNGTVYIASGGKHLKVKKLGTFYFAKLDVVESPETSVVYRMLKSVIDAGFANEIENLTDIPKTIIEVIKS